MRRALLAASLTCMLAALQLTPASARSVSDWGSTDETPSPSAQSAPPAQPSLWAPPTAERDETDPGVRRTPPYLQAVEPTGDVVPVSAAIVLTFSQPMSRPTVESTFAVRPRLDGSLTWLDDFTLRFKPIRLAHSISYQVEVAGRSVRGSPLTGTHSWRFSTAPGPPIVLAPGPSALRVPILMYHYIRVNPDPSDRMGFRLSITPSDFAAQMQWLAQNGYHPVTFRELDGYLAGQSGLPSRPVILTFDDGYADFYTSALPVLIEHDFKAVAYIVSGFVGQAGYMSAAQIQAADRAGIEIGSHTVDHADLTRQSPEAVRNELTSSKLALEQLLGHPVLSFCYPSGKFNPGVAAAVEAAGYLDATTTRWGSVRTLAGRYTWGRLRISGGESLGWFAADVQAVS